MFGRSRVQPVPEPKAEHVRPAALAVVRGEKVGKLLLVYIDTSAVPPSQTDVYVAEWRDRYAPVMDKLPAGWGILYVPADRSEITMLELT